MSEAAGIVDVVVTQPEDEQASTSAAECGADASSVAASEPVKTHDAEDTKAQTAGGERAAPAGNVAANAGSAPKLSKNAMKRLKKDQAWAVCHYIHAFHALSVVALTPNMPLHLRSLLEHQAGAEDRRVKRKEKREQEKDRKRRLREENGRPC